MNSLFPLLRALGLAFFCYLFIYNVPFTFLPFSSDKIVAGCGWIYLGMMLLSPQRKLVCADVGKGVGALLIIILGFSGFRGLQEGTLWAAYPDFHAALVSIPGALALKFWSYRLEPLGEKLQMPPVMIPVLMAGLGAAFISTFLVFDPVAVDIVRTSLMRYEGKAERLLNEEWLFRGFGLSAELTFGYSLVQGLMIVILVAYSIGKFRMMVLFIPLFLMSILYNARVGLVAFPAYFCALMYVFITRRSERAYALGSFAMLGGGVLIIMLLSPFLTAAVGFQEYWEWARDAVMAEFGFERGSGPTTLQVLFEVAKLPPDWNPIFGNGILLTAQWDPAFQSDVGYTTQLYYGGLLYFALWSLVLGIGFLWSFAHSKNVADRVVILSCGLMFLAANFKGDAIHSQTFFKILAIVVLARFPLDFTSPATRNAPIRNQNEFSAGLATSQLEPGAARP